MELIQEKLSQFESTGGGFIDQELIRILGFNKSSHTKTDE